VGPPSRKAESRPFKASSAAPAMARSVQLPPLCKPSTGSVSPGTSTPWWTLHATISTRPPSTPQNPGNLVPASGASPASDAPGSAWGPPTRTTACAGATRRPLSRSEGIRPPAPLRLRCRAFLCCPRGKSPRTACHRFPCCLPSQGRPFPRGLPFDFLASRTSNGSGAFTRGRIRTGKAKGAGRKRPAGARAASSPRSAAHPPSPGHPPCAAV